MKKSLIRVFISTAVLLFTSSLVAQTSQPVEPPKGNGSRSKDTSYSVTGATKDEVKGTSGQGHVSDTDTLPPPHKRKRRFMLYPVPNNTDATNGSNVAPGR